MGNVERLLSGEKPRPSQPVVDVVIVAYQPNLGSLMWCIDGYLECTPVPWNLVVVIDGAAQEDVAPICDFLAKQASTHARMVQHRIWAASQPRYFSASLMTGLANTSGAEFVVIGQPHVRVCDPEWFGKVQRPFQQDKDVGVVLFGDVAPDASSIPVRPQFAADVDTSRQLMALNPKLKLENKDAIRDLSWQRQMVAEAYRQWCVAWIIPTVRVSVLPGRTVHDRSSSQKVGPTVGTAPSRDRG